MSAFDENVDFITKLIQDLTVRAIKAEDELAKLNKRKIAAIPDLIDALQECAEYLDEYTDAEYDADGSVIGNREMHLYSTVLRALEKAGELHDARGGGRILQEQGLATARDG